MDLPKIGQIIKELRQKNKLRQKKLAELSGIEPATLSRIENNKENNIKVPTLNSILKALNLPTVEELIQDASNPNIKIQKAIDESTYDKLLELKGYIECRIKDKNSLASPPRLMP